MAAELRSNEIPNEFQPSMATNGSVAKLVPVTSNGFGAEAKENDSENAGPRVRDMEEGRTRDLPPELCCGARMLSATFCQKVGAEMIGTFFLVFAGCGAAVVDAKSKGALTHVGVAAIWGLVVMVMIYSTGHISGAHINPAVTLAFATVRHFPWKQVPVYVGAQTLAAICAAYALRLMFGTVAFLGGTLPAGSDMQSFALEIIITFALMFVVSSVATDTRAIGELAGLAVGSTVGMNAMLAGPISGASMNPARSLGPAIAANKYTSIWVYMVAPVIGSVAGAWAYNMIRLTNKPVREITKSGSFLKSQRSIRA